MWPCLTQAKNQCIHGYWNPESETKGQLFNLSSSLRYKKDIKIGISGFFKLLFSSVLKVFMWFLFIVLQSTPKYQNTVMNLRFSARLELRLHASWKEVAMVSEYAWGRRVTGHDMRGDLKLHSACSSSSVSLEFNCKPHSTHLFSPFCLMRSKHTQDCGYMIYLCTQEICSKESFLHPVLKKVVMFLFVSTLCGGM